MTLSTAPPSQLLMPKGTPRKAASPGDSHIIPSAEPYSIPSSNRLLAIEHPAILSSIDAGVRSLGGHDALTNAFNCPQEWMSRQDDRDVKPTLELRYRPDDVYEHPIVSQPVKVQNVVIKVGKKKQTSEIEKVEVVGVVDTVLRFRGDGLGLIDMLLCRHF